MNENQLVIMKFGVQVGDIVKVNTRTSPTSSGYCEIAGQVVETYPSGNFKLDASDPYFGYNTFSYSDIIR